MNAMTLSIIIPTRNEVSNLPRLLASLPRSPEVEVIVVDNRSRDETVTIAKAWGATVLTAYPERSAQRNAGAKVAKGQWLIFLDADMELTSGVLAELEAKFRSGSEAVIIPEASRGAGFWAKVRGFEKSLYEGDELLEAARAFRTEVYRRVGGYDETLIAAEDWDLTARLKNAGVRIDRISSPIIHHEGLLTLRHAFQKKAYYGRNLSHYIHKHPELARKQFRFIRPAFFRNGSKLLRHPILTLGLLVLKAADFSGGAAGLLRSKR